MKQPSPQTLSIHRPRLTRNIFPHLLVLIGGLLLFIDHWATKAGGIASLLGGLFALFVRTGIELDPANSRYRDFMRIGTVRWGSWKTMAEINYVAIVRVRMSQLAFRPSEASFRQSADKTDVAYNVNLILKEVPPKALKVFSGNLEQAMQQTIELSRALGLHIYDCSTPDKKWISPDKIK